MKYPTNNGVPLFTVSPAGTVSVDDEGGTVFIEDAAGNTQYLSVDADQAQAVLDRLVGLTTSLPKTTNNNQYN